MKTTWISIHRLKAHEFNTTIRFLNVEFETWPQRYEKVSELHQQAIKLLVKALSSLVVAYLVLSSLKKGNLVSITLGNTTASVPTALYALLASFFLFFAVTILNHFLVIQTIRAQFSRKISIPRFSLNMYGFIRGFDETALGIPIFLNLFLKEVLPVSRVLSFGMGFLLLALLMPFVAFGVYLGNVQFNLFTADGISGWEKGCNLFGIGILLFTAAMFLFFHIPLPYKKHTGFIRWLYLNRLPRNQEHPQLEKWLGK